MVETNIEVSDSHSINSTVTAVTQAKAFRGKGALLQRKVANIETISFLVKELNLFCCTRKIGNSSLEKDRALHKKVLRYTCQARCFGWCNELETTVARQMSRASLDIFWELINGQGHSIILMAIEKGKGSGCCLEGESDFTLYFRSMCGALWPAGGRSALRASTTASFRSQANQAFLDEFLSKIGFGSRQANTP